MEQGFSQPFDDTEFVKNIPNGLPLACNVEIWRIDEKITNSS